MQSSCSFPFLPHAPQHFNRQQMSSSLPKLATETKSRRCHYLLPALIAVVALAIILILIPSTSRVTRFESPVNLTPLYSSSEQLLEPPPNIRPTSYDYPLTTLLNIQAYKSLRHNQQLDHDLIQKHAHQRTRSIIARYLHQPAEPSQCSSTPSIPRLRQAVRSYFHDHYKPEHPHISDSTLVIHHKPDRLDVRFLQKAVELAKNFKRVRLLVPDRRIQRRLIQTPVIMHNRDTIDDTIGHMCFASHLLVHTGEISALGALVTSGTVYHTDDLSEYTSKSAFRWLLHNRVPLSAEKVSPYVPSLNSMGRVRPTCCDLKPFGEGDEEKIVCRNTGDFDPPCWILSVGSAGLFGFERDAVKKTQCDIHTFDCTGNWRVPSDIAERVTLHKLCLGEKEEGLFRTWEQVIKIGSDALAGTGKLTMPSFSKMDIEGYEFPVIRALVEGSDDVLPQQIAMEVHQNTILPVGAPFIAVEAGSKRSYVRDETIRELFTNMSKKGYDLVYRADNPFCSLCSEVTLVRRSALPVD